MKPAMQQLREDELGRKMLALTTLEGPVQSVTATVNFDDANPVEVLTQGGLIVLDAKVYVTTTFDAGTTNPITIAIGTADVTFGIPTVTFANAYDVSPPGGVPVTGFTFMGVDTPQFLPILIPNGSAVFLAYVPTGTAATQGAATVVVSYVLTDA